MAKSLVLGNGTMLLCFDSFGQVSDWYYPYVGLENHIGAGMVHNIGVSVDGDFSWFSSGEWDISIAYQEGTMASNIVARHEKLGLSLTFNDALYNEREIFVRQVTVHNETKKRREVKIFFNQQFRISESHYGDTAYYCSDEHALIHYRGRRWFLISGQTDGEFFKDYSIGLLGIEGKEGTWRDAEDSELSRNPIEHGTVDSVLGFRLLIGPQTHKNLSYWICVAKKFSDVTALHAEVQKKTPEHIESTTKEYWRAWATTRNFTFHGLSKEVVEQFKRSLFIVHAHTDKRGSIIASGDSDILQGGRDTYSYMWPRDAAFCALALDKAGYAEVTKRFFSFCNQIITKGGYFLHKYRPDRSLGSSWHAWVRGERAQLPIQEDETALVILGLLEHYKKSKDIEFIESVYNTLIAPAAEFMVSYRDEHTKLPLPSHDLWEERLGISCFTASSVYAALMAAHTFAELLGKHDFAKVYVRVADEMKEAIIKHFFIEDKKYFARMLVQKEDGEYEKDETMDASSAYGIFLFKVMQQSDPRLKSAFEVTKEFLSANGQGGIARYQGDAYFLQDATQPGNPWFITTFWYAEFLLAHASNEEELGGVKEVLEWAVAHSYYAGVFSEQLHPHTGEPISVTPLAWSHAGFVLLVIAYLEKLEALGICDTCYPLQSK